MLGLIAQLEARAGEITKPVTVALMGCVVNGIGEGRDADVGIACGRDEGVLFVRGQPVRTIKPEAFIDSLIAEANKL